MNVNLTSTVKLNTQTPCSAWTYSATKSLVDTGGALQIQDRSCKHVLRFHGSGPIQRNITFLQRQKHGFQGAWQMKDRRPLQKTAVWNRSRRDRPTSRELSVAWLNWSPPSRLWRPVLYLQCAPVHLKDIHRQNVP